MISQPRDVTTMNELQSAPPKRWAVVGGGMMGLTLAYRLAQRGQSVKLFEARPTLGGLADAWQLGDVVWDRHYHVTLLSDSHLRALLTELGLEQEMQWIETKTGFYCDGEFHSMSDTWEFLKFPPLKIWEKLRLGGTIFLASKIRDWRPMEQQLVETWLRRWSGNSTFQKIWLPLLKAKLGDAYRRTSAAFIWAHISRMYKARRTGQKKEMFGFVPGGYARILDTMGAALRKANVEIALGARIHEIATGATGRPTITLEGGGTESFDEVVITTPSSVVPHLCPSLPEEERDRHENIEYLGIVCASLLLKKPLRGFYVTNITDDVPFTAVIEMTTIVPREQLKGHTLVYLPKYATQADPIFQQSDDEVQEAFLTTFLRMYPELCEEDVAAFRVSRVRNVMAIPTIGYSKRLPPMQTAIPGVSVINSAHILKGNLNVNETVGLAEEAFASLLESRLTAASPASSGATT